MTNLWPRRGQDGRSVGIAHPKLKTPQLRHLRGWDIRADLHQQRVLPLPQPNFRTIVVESHPGVGVRPVQREFAVHPKLEDGVTANPDLHVAGGRAGELRRRVADGLDVLPDADVQIDNAVLILRNVVLPADLALLAVVLRSNVQGLLRRIWRCDTFLLDVGERADELPIENETEVLRQIRRLTEIFQPFGGLVDLILVSRGNERPPEKGPGLGLLL